MNKLIVFFLFMMIGSGIMVGIVAGGGGVVNTELTAAVNTTETTLSVNSTTDFLDEDDYVVVGSEKIYYTGTTDTSFTGCTRGYGDTTAKAHVNGARVYTQKAAGLNYALGFNIVAVQDNLGWAAIIAIPFMFFTTTIPLILKLSTQLLTGNLAIISVFFYAMAAGFVVTLAMSIIGMRRVS
jgi:hypothetical protein